MTEKDKQNQRSKNLILISAIFTILTLLSFLLIWQFTLHRYLTRNEIRCIIGLTNPCPFGSYCHWRQDSSLCEACLGFLFQGFATLTPQTESQNQFRQEITPSASVPSSSYRTGSEYQAVRCNYESPDSWEKRRLQEKDYDDFKLGAYSYGELTNSFIVAPIVSGGPTTCSNEYIFSILDDELVGGNLFEVVGKEIYVLNSNRGSFIDVYQIIFHKGSLARSLYYEVKFIKSIKPPAQVGTPYSIICEETRCWLETAFHLEAGCTMELELKTNRYSNIKCFGLGIEEFTPQPL